ncbi:MAG: right-handed parallel beta-helix repeat-containing protein [Thalassovita sp.]
MAEIKTSLVARTSNKVKSRMQATRWTCLFAALWIALSGAAAAQSFDEQVTGIYTTAPDFDFAVQLTLWPDGDGFAGDALIAAARYPVYGEQDGPALRGVFDVDGSLQRFTFLPSKSGPIAMQFSGEPAPILMTRASLPSFAGRFAGEFGAVTVRNRDGGLVAEWIDASGEARVGTGISRGLGITFADLPASIYYEPQEAAYYLDLPSYFGTVSPEAVPLRLGTDNSADFKTLAAALDAAPPGTTIEIMPGTYSGAALVDKQVTLVGGGQLGDVILTADSGTVLSWTANGGSLRNVAIRVPENGIGVDLNGGTLSVFDAKVTSTAGAVGIAATGSGTLSIDSTTLSGGDHAIRAAQLSGHLTVVGSTARDTTKSILSVEDTSETSEIMIEGSRFTNSTSNALRLKNVGKVWVSNNTISDVRVGLHHSGGSYTHLEANTLSNIGAHGIWFEGQHVDSIHLNGNKVDKVAQACLLLNRITFPNRGVNLRGNQFHNCSRISVAVAGDDTVANSAGLLLQDEAYRDSATHLAVYAPVPVKLERVQFSSSNGPGVVLGDGVTLAAKETSVRDSGEFGIVAIGDDIDVTLDNTQVSASGKSGIVLSGNVTAVMNGAEVSDNQGHGIEFHQGTVVSGFAGNAVSNNQGAGIFVAGVVFAPDGGNEITDNGEGDIKRQ